MVVSTHCWYVYSKIYLEWDSNTNWWLLSNTTGDAEACQLCRSGFGHYHVLRTHILLPRVSKWHMGWGPRLGEPWKPSEKWAAGCSSSVPSSHSAHMPGWAGQGRHLQAAHALFRLKECSFWDLSSECLSVQVTMQGFAGLQYGSVR